MQAEQKNCQNCKTAFQIEPEDFDFYEKMKVPPPTWCPLCRMMRRLAWQGFSSLYRRKCDFTGDMVVSNQHPDNGHKVFRQDIWWSDKWDPKSFGRDYNFSRPFFEQFSELFHDVPLPSLNVEYSTMVNSDYCNGAATLKNCYLCFRADHSEDCAYLTSITYMKDCFDLTFSDHAELSYFSSKLLNCYQCYYSFNCDNCQDVWFSRDMVGCSSCIGCIGLRNKKYHIFNKPVTKEEFAETLKKFDFGSYKNTEKFKKEAKEFMLKFPRKEYCGKNAINSSGDYLYNVKNVLDSYIVSDGENCKFAQFIKSPARNSMDYSMFGMNGEWIYESAWVGLTSNTIKFGVWDYGAHHQEYTFGCHSSGNLFGCVGVRSGEYCILNKQYSKEEYTSLVEIIKKHMDEMPYVDKLGREYRYGEMFPVELSPWTYNESLAQEWSPSSKETAVAKGFSWRDPDKKEYQNATMEIPDHIKDVGDEILKAILKCESCGKNYLLIRIELDFYRRFNLPIPRKCPNCRTRERLDDFNPTALYDRKCAKCGKDIKTSYAPTRPEIVYCETCYQNEVV